MKDDVNTEELKEAASEAYRQLKHELERAHTGTAPCAHCARSTSIARSSVQHNKLNTLMSFWHEGASCL